MGLRFGYGAVATAYVFLATSVAGGEEIRCDKFHIRATLDSDRVMVSLDTDCPDFSKIMVSVSRTYYQKGSGTAYSHSYFDEKSTVGNWRQPKRIPVTYSKWISTLENHRKKMSRLGLGYTVARIDHDLEVRMVLPVNQKDKRFGRRNENLVGKAVSTEGLRVVSAEVRILYPLDDASALKKRLPSTDPYTLDQKQIYRLAKETPLMPVLQPRDPWDAVRRMKRIPAGYLIEIIGVSNVHGNPWYKVVVTDGKSIRRGSGWVNSIALLGQELIPVKR